MPFLPLKPGNDLLPAVRNDRGRCVKSQVRNGLQSMLGATELSLGFPKICKKLAATTGLDHHPRSPFGVGKDTR